MLKTFSYLDHQEMENCKKLQVISGLFAKYLVLHVLQETLNKKILYIAEKKSS